MAYPAVAVANFFITKAKNSSQDLSPMKLLKLVYLAHGWYLALEQRALIDEPIVAWQFGPVVESLYHEFKHYGNDKVTDLVDIENNEAVTALGNDKVALAILDRVWEIYGSYTAIQLSKLTHEKGSPWDIAWHAEDGKNNRNHCIQNYLIQEYYTKQATQH